MKITEGLCNAKLLQSGSVVYMMSSLMGSIGDNGSGNVYGYRMSKATSLNRCFIRSSRIDTE